MGLNVENRSTSANPAIVVMGVAGVGKTTVAQALAAELGLPYGEADDFHPQANIDKMAAGILSTTPTAIRGCGPSGPGSAPRRPPGTEPSSPAPRSSAATATPSAPTAPTRSSCT
ncbi:hypothetical protein ACFQZC_31320 [Streptacidiphilus monticola]